MPKGKCEDCDAVWYGWSLEYKKHRTCDKCGGRVIIISGGGHGAVKS